MPFLTLGPCGLLFSDIEFLDDRPVTLDVLGLQVFEKAPALPYQTDKGTFGHEVLLIAFEVFGQVLDLHGEEGDLRFGGTAVKFGLSVVFKCLFLYFG